MFVDTIFNIRYDRSLSSICFFFFFFLPSCNGVSQQRNDRSRQNNSKVRNRRDYPSSMQSIPICIDRKIHRRRWPCKGNRPRNRETVGYHANRRGTPCNRDTDDNPLHIDRIYIPNSRICTRRHLLPGTHHGYYGSSLIPFKKRLLCHYARHVVVGNSTSQYSTIIRFHLLNDLIVVGGREGGWEW